MGGRMRSEERRIKAVGCVLGESQTLQRPRYSTENQGQLQVCSDRKESDRVCPVEDIPSQAAFVAPMRKKQWPAQ